MICPIMLSEKVQFFNYFLIHLKVHFRVCMSKVSLSPNIISNATKLQVANPKIPQTFWLHITPTKSP
jgi:hypothetical protein